MTDDNDRIELEIKISHQEVALEELQKIVWEQETRIDRLEKTIQRLNDRLNGEAQREIGPANEKPPHY